MHVPKAAMALLATAVLMPFATAEMTFDTPEDTVQLSPSGDQTLEFTPHLSCDEFLTGIDGTLLGEGMQSRDIAVGLPDGFTGDENVTVDFDGTECAQAADPQTTTVSGGNQTISITPGDSVPGMEEMTVTLTSGDDTDSIPILVGYRQGYSFDVSEQFPVTVTKDENGDWIPVEFTATITVTANANTMVMMQVTDKTEYGSLSGLFASVPKNFRDLTDEQRENGITQTVNFRYEPTSDGWEEEKVEFVTWSHYLDDATAGQTPDQSVSWTFVNGAADSEGGKGIPGFGALPAIIALLGAALVAVRRRS